MPVWETAGSAAWRLAFSTRWRRCSCRRWAMGCVTNTACSSSPSKTAGSTKQPDNWLRRQDPWEVARPHETVEVKLNCSFEMRRRTLARRAGPALRADRHPVRSARRRLRRQDHQYVAPVGRRRARLFRLSGIQQRRFRRRAGRDSRGRIADPGAVSRRLHRAWDRRCASCRSIFWSPARWPISCGASAAAMPIGTRCPTRSRSSSTTRIRRWRCRS